MHAVLGGRKGALIFFIYADTLINSPKYKASEPLSIEIYSQNLNEVLGLWPEVKKIWSKVEIMRLMIENDRPCLKMPWLTSLEKHRCGIFFRKIAFLIKEPPIVEFPSSDHGGNKGDFNP